MLSRRTLLASAALLPFVATRLRAETLDDVVSPGVIRGVVISWGDRVEPDSPPFAPDAMTAHAAARQFGWDGVVLGIMAQPQGEDGVPRALLAVAHPSVAPLMMFPSATDRPDVAMMAQGASILNLERHDADWLVTDGGYQTRRITGRTLCRITGPAVPLIGDGIEGVLAPRSGGFTPWGTLLLAEGDATAFPARLAHNPGQPEANQAAYGWVVELDPTDPQALPAKRTALGRFARAGIASAVAQDGRAVVFMSDDRQGGHLFRFVTATPANASNPDALDHGVLSAAVLDGTVLRFVPITNADAAPLATLDGARAVHATRFDAPCGMAFAAGNVLLLACRGAAGQSGAPSVLGDGNPDGRVLVLRPQGGDPAASAFDVELGLSGGDNGMGGAIVSHPTSLAVGRQGEIWIGAQSSGVAVATPGFSRLTQIYRPPVGAEMGGMALTPDGAWTFTAVRHPGATPDATYAQPATRWPSLRPDMPPQTTIVRLSRR